MRFVFNALTGNFDLVSEVSLAAVGSTPNANGATLTGQVLNLEPADLTHPGVVTSSIQTFGGIKNFTRQVAIGGTSDETQFSIQGNASQTNNILEIITSGFSYMMKLDAASKLSVYGDIGAQGNINALAYFGPTAATATSGVYNLANTETIAFRNNLNNADKSLSLSSGNIFQMDAGLTSTGVLTGTQLVSTVSTGTAPLSVSSTTQVSNLYASRAALADTVTTNANLTGDVTSSGNATTYAGVVPETKGGTAQSTYATGDTLYASASNTLSKRTIGNTADVLTVAGGIPTWAPPATPTTYSWTGYHDLSVGNWYFNTTAYTDPTSQDANGNAIVEVDNNGFGTVASLVNGSAKYPGITFTNPVAGRYRVSCSLIIVVPPSAGQFMSAKLTDGTTVIDESQHISVAASSGILLTGIIYFSTSASRTIKVQAAASATTSTISNTGGPATAMARWAIELI